MIAWETNRVFIGVFNILASSLETIQEFFHSCRPFLDFFVQVMVFCNEDWTSFKLTSERSTQILVLSISCWLLLTWHAQNMTLQMGMLVEGHNKKQQKVNNLKIDKVCDQNLQIFHEKLLLTRKEEICFYKKYIYYF